MKAGACNCFTVGRRRQHRERNWSKWKKRAERASQICLNEQFSVEKRRKAERGKLEIFVNFIYFFRLTTMTEICWGCEHVLFFVAVCWEEIIRNNWARWAPCRYILCNCSLSLDGDEHEISARHTEAPYYNPRNLRLLWNFTQRLIALVKHTHNFLDKVVMSERWGGRAVWNF